MSYDSILFIQCGKESKECEEDCIETTKNKTDRYITIVSLNENPVWQSTDTGVLQFLSFRQIIDECSISSIDMHLE